MMPRPDEYAPYEDTTGKRSVKLQRVTGRFYVGGKWVKRVLANFSTVGLGKDGRPIDPSPAAAEKRAALLARRYAAVMKELEAKEDARAKGMTFRQGVNLYLDWIEANRSKKTHAMYAATADRFEPIVGRKPLPAISKTDIDSYITALRQDGLSSTSINLELRQLRAFFNHAYHSEWIDRVPHFRREEEPESDRGTLPPEAPGKLLAYIEGLRTTAKGRDAQVYRNWWRYVVLEMGSFMRPGEARSRKVADLDFKRGQVWAGNNEIHRMKKGRERWQPVQAWAMEKLEADLKESPGAVWLLEIVSKDRKRRKPAYRTTAPVSHFMARLWDAIGYTERDWVAAHVFRATGATELLEAGAEETGVQHVLGHSQLSTTRRYVRRRDKQKRRAMDAVDFGKWMEQSKEDKPKVLN